MWRQGTGITGPKPRTKSLGRRHRHRASGYHRTSLTGWPNPHPVGSCIQWLMLKECVGQQISSTQEGNRRRADTAVSERRWPDSRNRGDETISPGETFQYVESGYCWTHDIWREVWAATFFRSVLSSKGGYAGGRPSNCKNRRYEGGRHNMYAEVLSTSRGRKAAAIPNFEQCCM